MFCRNPAIQLIESLSVILIPVSAIVLFLGVDYRIRAEATVNAINQECGTEYVRLDYLRIGAEAMLAMCETRQKRIELAR